MKKLEGIIDRVGASSFPALRECPNITFQSFCLLFQSRKSAVPCSSIDLTADEDLVPKKEEPTSNEAASDLSRILSNDAVMPK